MNITTLNVSLLIGWLMVTAGCMVKDFAIGLAVGGGLLIVLTLGLAIFAGVFAKKANY